MKILLCLLLFSCLFVPITNAQIADTNSVSATAPSAASQTSPTPDSTQNVTITVGDLQIFRQIEAERASLARECDELRTSCDKAEESAKKWQEKYEQEKHRADVVQEQRIAKIASAYDEKNEALLKSNAANAQLHEQHKTDVQEIANLRFDVSKLKGDRWRWGAVGFITGSAAGAVGGFYVGHKSKDTNILFGSKGGLADYRLATIQF